MKRMFSVLLCILLLVILLCTACAKPDPGPSLNETTTTTLGATTASPQLQGETKRFQYENLILEITNVASTAMKTTTDDGTEPREYPVYTLYPGAQLIVVNADMTDGSLTESGLPRAHWYVYSDLPDKNSGEGDTYIPITDNMPPLTITPDMKSVFTGGGSVLAFAMYDR